jgi:predicted Zn finger-like uncharacterized protein
MRLTCPNCSARYEVDDSLIPAEGRDVQCSNCATTWFQPGRRVEARPVPPATEVPGEGALAGEAAEVEAAEPGPEETGPEDAPDGESLQEDRGMPSGPEEEVPSPSEAEPAPEAEAGPEGEPPSLAAATPQRRRLDPELRNILEEEAARETQLRRAEAEPVETQAEMPLSANPEEVARARLRAGLDAARDAFDPKRGAPRAQKQAARDLFPDIEEINSSLRDTGDRSQAEAHASDIDTLDTLPRRRRGKRIGFLLAVTLAAGAAGLYANAPRLAEAVPALAPGLSGYVVAVDEARFWLDDMARRVAGGAPGG